jgi:hypothetical protein
MLQRNMYRDDAMGGQRRQGLQITCKPKRCSAKEKNLATKVAIGEIPIWKQPRSGWNGPAVSRHAMRKRTGMAMRCADPARLCHGPQAPESGRLLSK